MTYEKKVMENFEISNYLLIQKISPQDNEKSKRYDDIWYAILCSVNISDRIRQSSEELFQ